MKKLIAEMALEEKVAQLICVESKNLIDENSKFSAKKAEACLKHGMGQIANPSMSLDLRPEDVTELTAQVQRWLIQNTRMKIPVLFHEECIGGLTAKCAPMLPHPIGLSSIWEPELVYSMTASFWALMRSMGIHQALSPVLDISHDPRWRKSRRDLRRGRLPRSGECLRLHHGPAGRRPVQGHSRHNQALCKPCDERGGQELLARAHGSQGIQGRVAVPVRGSREKGRGAIRHERISCRRWGTLRLLKGAAYRHTT